MKLNFRSFNGLFHLISSDKPEAPKQPEAVDTTRSSVTLKWLPPAKDGGNPIFNYIIEYRSLGSSKWLVANSNIKVPETSFVVKDLVQGAEYEFRVAAENKAGVGPMSPPSVPITAREPVGEYMIRH